MPLTKDTVSVSNYARKPKVNSATATSPRSQFGDRPIYARRRFRDDKTDGEVRRLELERLRELLDLERRRNYAEREERQRALDEKFARETNWRRLMQKAGLAYKVGKFGAGWTWEDDAWADRLGVEMGYLKPWNRNYQVKVGGR